jgi:hypothetical protein
MVFPPGRAQALRRQGFPRAEALSGTAFRVAVELMNFPPVQRDGSFRIVRRPNGRNQRRNNAPSERQRVTAG